MKKQKLDKKASKQETNVGLLLVAHNCSVSAVMHGPPVSSARPEGPKMHNPKMHNAKQSKDAQRTASGRRATPRHAPGAEGYLRAN